MPRQSTPEIGCFLRRWQTVESALHAILWPRRPMPASLIHRWLPSKLLATDRSRLRPKMESWKDRGVGRQLLQETRELRCHAHHRTNQSSVEGFRDRPQSAQKMRRRDFLLEN